MMKTTLILIAIGTIAAGAAHAQTTNVLTDTFDTYTAGPLIGQGSWTITGTSTTNPLTVTNPGGAGFVPLANTGQDAYEAFTTAVTHTDGNILSTTFSLNLSAAGSGDYFAHVSNPAGTTSNFYERVYAKSTTGGYLLGLSDTGTTQVYGTTVIPFGTPITVNVIWNFVPGAFNDFFQLNVNGAAYSTFTWSSATAEPTTIAAFNLRQGTASSAPTATSFDTVAVDSIIGGAVPEPSTYAMIGLGLVGLVGVQRMRRQAA